MNILAIDYGSKNIGLAKASSGVDLVLPFGVIKNTDQELAMAEIVNVIKTEKIDRIVIGLPFGLDGSENANTAKIRDFAKFLEGSSGTPVEFANEVFSSQASDRLSGGVSRDEKSAMIILQSYLDKLKK